MESLFLVTWTIPESDRIKTIFVEEFPEFSWNERQLNLIRMNWQVKDSLHGIYWIWNNNNSIDVG